MHVNPLKYRADIDGLRAVAVVCVVLFHTSANLLRGGFLGVDVFFVISGFLITGILVKDAEKGRFSLRNFYERRVRRILPALLATLIVATALSCLILLPIDLIGMAKSVLASLAFVANVYFWRDTDYFSRIAEEKPLLHIWSLGIEEQFYVLFPLLIVLFVRHRRVLLTVTVLTVALSLALNMVAVRVGGASPAFFLLPTRAWELGAGALLALLPGLHVRSRPIAELLGTIAVALIGLGLWWPVPIAGGLVLPAMPVVAGAALVILLGRSGGPGSWINRLLSARVMVAVGLVSFSLYLWHWPVLVISRYYLVRDLFWYEALLALVAMGVLAAVSWRYVEQPFRHGRMTTRRVLAWTGTGYAVLLAASGAIIAAQGLPGRLNPAAARINAAVGSHYRCAVSDYIYVGSTRACRLYVPNGEPRAAELVLLGNSHAQMYAPLVRRRLAETGMPGILIPMNSCLPMPDVNISPDCLAIARANLATLDAMPRVRAVILAMTWEDVPVLTPQGEQTGRAAQHSRIASLDRLVARFARQGRRVAIVGPIAPPGWDVASVVGRKLAFGRPIREPLARSRAAFLQEQGPVLQHFANRRDVVLVRPDLDQCDARACPFVRNGRSLFSDSSHLAQEALPLFAPAIENAMDRLTRPLPAAARAHHGG